MTYVHIDAVHDLVKQWQADCSKHPAIYNQANVIRDRLDKLVADIETPIDHITVSGWGVWAGHTIPVAVCRHIASKVNSLLAGKRGA